MLLYYYTYGQYIGASIVLKNLNTYPITVK